MDEVISRLDDCREGAESRCRVVRCGDADMTSASTRAASGVRPG